MVDFLKKKCNTKNGILRYYYYKQYKNGKKKTITKEEYKNNTQSNIQSNSESTYCSTQNKCWKSSSSCDMSCEWKTSKNIPCNTCASYCDLSSNKCRCTKKIWPKKNNVVDWKTFKSKCSK